MPTLLLRLSAPLQSWGTDSKFDKRRTEHEPSRSGIIGMLAAALGLRRDADLSQFDRLKIGVRADRDGKLLRDFHTVRGKDAYVTERMYLADAVFLVGIYCSDKEYLEKLEYALSHPAFQLYLGRRSCPPSLPLVYGMRDSDLRDTLLNEPNTAEEKNSMRLVMETEAGKGAKVRDVPVSFNPEKRSYTWRFVSMETVDLSQKETEHDAMNELE